MKTISTKPEINIHGKIPSEYSETKIKKMILKSLQLSKSSATNIGVAFVSPAKMSTYNNLYRKI